ncbi:YfcC family protein [Terrisporobacter sp.]
MNKKTFSFPTAYTVILIVMLIVLALTYIIPAGKYAKLQYDSSSNVFLVESPKGDLKEYKGNQKTLDELKVNIGYSRFKDGSISKPVAIPGTYEKPERPSTSILGALTTIFKAPVKGLYDSIEIIAFVLVIGGLIGIINKTGAFTAGINALSHKSKGKESLLIIIICTLVAIGGTTFGLAEETIAFYPIVVPIFIAAGYDALVAIAAIYLGSCIGTMASTVNPFSTVIASNTAGIDFTQGMTLRLIMLVIGLIICIVYIIRYGEKIKKDPSASYIYSQREELERQFLSNKNNEDAPEFTLSRKMILIIFALAFVIMVYGVKELGWWFEEMTALFIVVTFIMIFFAKLSEKEFVSEFMNGAADLLGVGIIIGLARGVTIIMENGMISDTILNSLSLGVAKMNGIVFSTFIFFVYIILGFFISSSSGLAVLSMPVMAPLADVVGISRDVIVSAYQFGQGIMSFITPTGLILASLAMVNVTYDKWLKFVLPLVIIIGVLAIVMLGLGVLF